MHNGKGVVFRNEKCPCNASKPWQHVLLTHKVMAPYKGQVILWLSASSMHMITWSMHRATRQISGPRSSHSEHITKGRAGCRSREGRWRDVNIRRKHLHFKDRLSFNLVAMGKLPQQYFLFLVATSCSFRLLLPAHVSINGTLHHLHLVTEIKY